MLIKQAAGIGNIYVPEFDTGLIVSWNAITEKVSGTNLAILDTSNYNGISRKFNRLDFTGGVAAGKFQFTTPAETEEVTFVFIFDKKASYTSQLCRPVSFYNGSGVGRFDVYTNVSSNLEIQSLRSGANGIWSFIVPTGFSVVVASLNASSTTNDPVVFCNGARLTTTEVTTPSGALVTPHNVVCVGGRNDVSTRQWEGSLYYVGVYNRAVSDAEAARLSRINPTVTKRVFYPQAAAGGTTVTPTTGEIQWTGATPSLFTRRDATPTAGAFAWTGDIISYTTGAGISTQTPLAGEIVWGGNTPAIYTIKTLAPGGGEITWTGSTPTITTITGKEVAPLTGSLEWTGSAPSLYTRVNVSPATGAIAWTGSTISYTTGDHCQWTVEARVSGNWNTETRYTGSWTTESRPSGTWNRKTRICE